MTRFTQVKDKRRGFVFVAIIGVAAVLFVLVFSIAATVGQTRDSIKVLENKKDYYLEIDNLLSAAVSEYKEQPSPTVTKDFSDNSGKATFSISKASSNNPFYKQYNLKFKEGDLLVTAKVTSFQYILNAEFDILVREGRRSGKNYIILKEKRP
jgi:hypothetical protein